jgi:hypothetical protein
MSPKDIHPIFPHSRIIGPMIMPFSNKTMNLIKYIVNKKKVNSNPNIIFTGSLYEPRVSELNAINKLLNDIGLEIEFKGRNLGTERITDDEYWHRLASASIVITTSSQISSKDTDWTTLPHLIYRYLEVPVAGSLLIAPIVPSIERFFKPGEHFVSYSTPEDAAYKIAYYLEHHNEREIIANRGHSKAKSIVKSNLYWISIDLALGKHSII